MWWNFASKQSSLIPNTSGKPHAPEKSGLGCTVVARLLFWDLIIFLTFLCDTTLWQSDAVVWTTWNVDRMCTRYSYLKLKERFSKNFSNFFQKILFANFAFSNLFLKKSVFFLDFFLFCCSKFIFNQKSFLTKIFFVFAEIN